MINSIDGLVGQAFSQISMFNNICGNSDKSKEADGESFKTLLESQIKLVDEELTELKDALSDKNDLETLDAVCDLFVVVSNLMVLLDNKSRAREALLEVCANNLTKYVQVTDPNAKSIIDATIQMYKDKGEEVTVELNRQFGVYVFKDANGKIRKPSNYRSVDLVSYL